MRKLNSEILKSASYEDVIRMIDDKIHRTRSEFDWNFSKDIAGNAKWKSIICRTSAMLEEPEIAHKLLFGGVDIDIEHIQCATDLVNAEKVRIEWKGTLNSIGNLIVLERGLNRGIKNDPHKKESYYGKSGLKIIQNLLADGFRAERWTKEKAEERRKSELEKLSRYYYHEGPVDTFL